MRGHRDLGLFVGCALMLVAAAACSGGGSSGSGKAPDGAKIATATLPAKLPEAKILGNSAAQSGGGSTYTVKEGDTLAGIAGRFGVSLEDLRAANPSIDAATLRIGQSVKLPENTSAAAAATPTAAKEAPTSTVAPPTAAAPPTEAPPPTSTPAPIADTPVPAPTAPASGGTYVVQEGDFPAKIAQKLGISLEDLLAANPGINSTDLHIGQILNLPPSR